MPKGAEATNRRNKIARAVRKHTVFLYIQATIHVFRDTKHASETSHSEKQTVLLKAKTAAGSDLLLHWSHAYILPSRASVSVNLANISVSMHSVWLTGTMPFSIE